MSDPSPDYADYVAAAFMPSYLTYQARYADEPRESDKVLIDLVANSARTSRSDEPSVVLDIGCSNGNLLRHLHRRLPDLRLVGGELSDEALDICRADPTLSAVEFRKLDITNMKAEAAFDVVVANAVLFILDDRSFESAIRSLSISLRPGGRLVAFDFFHSFPQHLAIREVSRSHPDGMTLQFRPIDDVRSLLERSGFGECKFLPFRIPIDLPQGVTFGSNADGFEDLNTHTIRTEQGERMLFRGTLHQPWCHLTATRTDR